MKNAIYKMQTVFLIILLITAVSLFFLYNKTTLELNMAKDSYSTIEKSYTDTTLELQKIKDQYSKINKSYNDLKTKETFINANSTPIINFTNANSRDTYFSIHNLKMAQDISKGKGIKVGILDWCFGYEKHKSLYSGCIDFTGDADNLLVEHHGFWMASVLKEIAPECEIYGLGITVANRNETKKVDAIVKAIDWAIENKIDVLTYSNEKFSDKNIKKVDDAVNKAISHNIITTFIHYPNKNNILPGPLLQPDLLYDGREPDVNIFQYDYNTLRISEYNKYLESGGKYYPYWSISSTSPVTAGFIAILKNVNNNLTPGEYKDILIKTSKKKLYDNYECPRVVDIYDAVKYLQQNY